MANCPDDNDMACYIDGLLSDDEIRQIEKHLLDCDRCREEVEVTKKVVARVGNWGYNQFISQRSGNGV